MKEGDNFLKNSQFGEFGKKKGINFFEKTAPFLFSHHLSKFDYFLNGLKKEIEEIFPIVFSAGTTESFLELSKIKKRIINFSDNFQFEKIDSRQELIILGVVRYVFRANLNGKVARAKQLADLSDADLFIPKTSFFPILNKEVEGKLLFLISKFLNPNLPKESPIFSKIKWNLSSNFNSKNNWKKVTFSTTVGGRGKVLFLFEIKFIFDPEKEGYIVSQLSISERSEVTFLRIPLMDSRGRFVINGNYRVVVPQLVRSSLFFFYYSQLDRQDRVPKKIRIIPVQGSWLFASLFEKGVEKFDSERIMNFDVSLAFSSGSSLSSHHNVFSLVSLIDELWLSVEDLNKIFFPPSSHQGGGDLDDTQKKSSRLLFSSRQIPFDSRQVWNDFFNKQETRFSVNKSWRERLLASILEQALDYFFDEDIKLKNGDILIKKGNVFSLEIFLKIFNNLKHFEKKDTIIFSRLPSRNTEDIGAEKQKKKNDSPVWPANRMEGVNLYRLRLRSKFGQSISVLIFFPLDETKTKDTEDSSILHPADFLNLLSFFVNLQQGVSKKRIDSDSLEFKKLKTCGDVFISLLKNRLSLLKKNCLKRFGEFSIIKKKWSSNFLPFSVFELLSTAIISDGFNSFLSSSFVSQFLDQSNPLAELAHLRKITSVGSSALSRETANVAVRDIRNSYYGRICPIETPEGVNIGLVSNLALQTKVDLSGEILSPSVTSNMKDFEYLSSFQDKFSVIGDFFSFRDPDSKEISCRYFGQEFVKLLKTDRRVTNSDYSPFQILSLSSSILPFIEHSDASRMMIAANMLKQALVCARPQRSLIATGSEELIGHYSTSLIRSTSPGIVTYVDSSVVKVLSKKTETQKEKITTYKLSSFAKTNQDVAFSHQPVVNLRAKVKKGSVLAEGSGIVDGELFLGQNVVVAYLSFEGFNYEDAVVVSERVVKNDIFTSYTVTKYVCERYRSSIAEEKFSNKIPGVSPSILAKLDYRGFIKVGSYVKDGDILVGKISGAVRFESVGLMGKIQQLSQKLGETLTQLNSSLYAKRRTWGVVKGIKVLRKGDKNVRWPADNCLEIVNVYVAEKRNLSVGDKLVGRFGNKGIVSKIVPEEDMPFLTDGTQIDVILNPLGVPSRMNIGQLFESKISAAIFCSKEALAVPPFVFHSYRHLFNSAKSSHLVNVPFISRRELKDRDLEFVGFNPEGIKDDLKVQVISGGEGNILFNSREPVGISYMFKLSHMIEDKVHARSVGRYKLITQQPIGGKAREGGMRFGEMEVWNLESYNTPFLLQEMMTLKSDDVFSRRRLFSLLTKEGRVSNKDFRLRTGTFNMLINQLKALGLSFDFGYSVQKEEKRDESSEKKFEEN